MTWDRDEAGAYTSGPYRIKKWGDDWIALSNGGFAGFYETLAAAKAAMNTR